MNVQPGFYRLSEASTRMALSESEVRREITRGNLDASKHGRVWQITVASVEQWVADRTEACRQERARQCGQQYLRGGFTPTNSEPTRIRGGRGLAALDAAIAGTRARSRSHNHAH